MSIEMLWGSQAERIVRQAFERAMVGADWERRLSSEHRLDMLEDAWKYLLERRIRDFYESDELFALLRPHLSTGHNIFKRIMSELSQVYKWGAVRELADPRENEKARLLWEEVAIDEVLEVGNLWDNALRDNVILPLVDDGKMRLEILPPSRFSVIQHPRIASQAAAVWFDRRSMDTPPGALARLYGASPWRLEHVVVDDVAYTVYDTEGKVIDRVVHGIGRFPGVIVHAEKRMHSFFGPNTGEDAVEENYNIGWLLSGLAFMQKMQAELQPTYQGDPEDIAEGTAMGAHTVLAAKGPFSTLDLQADPTKYLAHIKERIRLLALNYGLGPDAYDVATPSSGFQFRMQRMPLLEARRKQIKKWRAVERELYVVMALLAKRFHPLLKPDPEAEFTINYGDPTFAESPEIENRVDAELIEMGLASQVDVIMRRDPDLPRERAVVKARRILEEKAMYVGWAKDLNTSMAPDGTEKTPQENGADGARAKGKAKPTDDDRQFARAALKRFRQGA